MARLQWVRVLPWLGLLTTAVLAGCDNGETPQQAAKPQAAATVDLLFAYSSEKQAWVEAATRTFNARGVTLPSGERIRVRTDVVGSGELIQDVLSGRRKPQMISPASALFVDLGNAQSRTQTGRNLVETSESLVLSPVVIAMWKPMAQSLGWGKQPVGWQEVLALATDPQGWAAHGHAEWGRFKLGHTHPEFSNSGLLTVLAEVYAATDKVGDLNQTDVQRPQTAQFLEAIEGAVVHYGRSTGFFGKRMFANGPDYLSAAVLYENMVIEANQQPGKLAFPVVAVYPKEGTFWSDHPAGIVARDWVSPKQQAAARKYLGFLLERPQQELAMTLGFRPADVAVPLGAPVDRAHGVDPQEPKTTLGVPSPDVVNAVIELWRQHKRHTDLVLVLDRSGSMKGEKMKQAKAGAQALLSALDAQDCISLLPFDHQPRWADQDACGAAQREAMQKNVETLFASGGTALYDAIGAAYEHLQTTTRPGRITAVVALSDGHDQDSRLSLEGLLQRVGYRAEAGEGVRIFTIAYGDDADAKVLERIADATRGHAYRGGTGNIEAVFRDIATFF
jgi:Ca-activated chloride channel family protein